MCFLALNANLQLDPVSMVHKDFDTEKLAQADAIPHHKLFMATDIFRGHSLSRVFVDSLTQSKPLGDLTRYATFQDYAHDPANDFHLSPIELYLREFTSPSLFGKVTAAGLLATT
jgi:hypothetical protein